MCFISKLLQFHWTLANIAVHRQISDLLSYNYSVESGWSSQVSRWRHKSLLIWLSIIDNFIYADFWLHLCHSVWIQCHQTGIACWWWRRKAKLTHLHLHMHFVRIARMISTLLLLLFINRPNWRKCLKFLFLICFFLFIFLCHYT